MTITDTDPMRICIYGLGAVGGYLAARLVTAGERVCAVTRAATLRAVARDGLTLIERAGEGGELRQTVVPLQVAEAPATLGPQDLVVLSVKTTGLADVARDIAPLLGPDTIVLSATNGVPWWFFHGLDAQLAARQWPSLDPHGELGAAIPLARVLGCVVYLDCSVSAPGVLRHARGNRLVIGEPAGGESERARRVAALLSRAGIEAEVSARIQQDVWFKLWGNMAMNAISAITGATTDRVLDDPLARSFVTNTMLETAAVGERIGVPVPIAAEQRHQLTRQLGAFKTSMLQDVEAGKPVELDALLGIVVELGTVVGVPTPNIDALFALARLHGRTHGLYSR